MYGYYISNVISHFLLTLLQVSISYVTTNFDHRVTVINNIQRSTTQLW